jgi:inhibitor of cysteine peptidase
MKIVAIAGALVLVVAALAIAQGQAQEGEQGPESAVPKPEDLKQPTITQSYQVKPGSRFRINLESNRSTGYQWRLARPVDQKVIKLVGSGYQSPEVKLPGAGGKEIWTFEAVAAGRTEISMQYVRPWEKGVPPARTARFSVVVK